VGPVPNVIPKWEVLDVAIDDATRLVYAELLPDERGRTTARFLVRALRWLIPSAGDRGHPPPHGQRRRLSQSGVQSSQALARSAPFADPTLSAQTNGKAERWIRTVLSECLYIEVFNSAAERRLALDRFIGYYNGQRPQLGIGGRTPRQRLTDLMAA
jgi:transposase InsO family protein